VILVFFHLCHGVPDMQVCDFNWMSGSRLLDVEINHLLKDEVFHGFLLCSVGTSAMVFELASIKFVKRMKIVCVLVTARVTLEKKTLIN
jgi:hypothetical protein